MVGSTRLGTGGAFFLSSRTTLGGMLQISQAPGPRAQGWLLNSPLRTHPCLSDRGVPVVECGDPRLGTCTRHPYCGFASLHFPTWLTDLLLQPVHNGLEGLSFLSTIPDLLHGPTNLSVVLDFPPLEGDVVVLGHGQVRFNSYDGGGI